jgi:hypothetical protein
MKYCGISINNDKTAKNTRPVLESVYEGMLKVLDDRDPPEDLIQ